jgi:hypothetical protein
MNYSHTLKWLLLLFISLWFSAIYGQGNCSELLLNANKAYNDGKYEQVISLLKADINNCNFNKIEQEQATKLLASAFSKIDEVEKAELLVYKLLKKNPNYVVQATVDPQPFVTVLNSFERSPRSIIGFNVGVYSPIINVEDSYAIFDAADYTSKYKTQSSVSFSLYYQYFITQKWSVSVVPEISSFKFSREISADNLVSINYSEKASYIKTPIMIGYEVYKKTNFSTTLSAGLYGSYFWGSQYNVSYQLPDAAVIESEGDLLNQRNSNNYGCQVGINFGYIKNRLRFSAGLNYSADLKLYNNADNRFTVNNLLLDYYYVDDNIKLSQLDLKLGVAYTFSYKIKHKYRSK